MGLAWRLHKVEAMATKYNCSALSHAALPSFCDGHHHHSHVLDPSPYLASHLLLHHFPSFALVSLASTRFRLST